MSEWQPDEHDRFLEALDLFSARDLSLLSFDAIATFVKTRSKAEVKEHALKYFQRLSKSKEKTWTREEDLAFEDALAKYMPKEDALAVDRWEKIAACVPGRTSDDVYERFKQLVADLAAIMGE